jgi:hypothetical protein
VPDDDLVGSVAQSYRDTDAHDAGADAIEESA